MKVSPEKCLFAPYFKAEYGKKAGGRGKQKKEYGDSKGAVNIFVVCFVAALFCGAHQWVEHPNHKMIEYHVFKANFRIQKSNEDQDTNEFKETQIEESIATHSLSVFPVVKHNN